MSLAFLTIKEASKLISKKEISPLELTNSVLERIQEYDKKLNSYITVLEENAISSAKKAEEEIQSGEYKGPLHGIPISLKDIFITKGIKTTCGSGMLENFIPPYDSTVAKKLAESYGGIKDLSTEFRYH